MASIAENAAQPAATAPVQGRSAKQWMSELGKRRKVLAKDWYRDAKHAIEIYETKDKEKTPFNILFSNVETMLPALYNSTPRPDVARRFGMDAGTPAAAANHAAAEISNRFLTYVSDSGSAEFEDYSTATSWATLSALLTGWGTSRVHSQDQQVYFEQVPFDRFLWGFARTWKQVPWVAYGQDMSKPEFEKQFPQVLGQPWYQTYTWPESSDGTGEEDSTPGSEQDKNLGSNMLVWEIWDWQSKTITFVCKGDSEQPLHQEAYPFNLTSRFPSPEPIQLIKRLLNLTPLVPYESYRKEAEQLQMVTRRLNLVMKAIKVRGVYNTNLGELGQLLNDETDNKLIPAESASAFVEGKGLDAQIWFLPIEMLVKVAQQMTVAQTEIKNTIYEIIGIADVMRGAGAASETLGAQQIKNQWGTLRMKRAQKDIQVFCRDLFRIALEYGVHFISPQQMKLMTGVPYPLKMEKEQALQGKQIYDQQTAQSQQTGSPPPPPPTPTQLANATLPTVEDALAILGDNFQRQYRIDIETNSTIDLEATEDQKNVGDFMNAFGQMMAGLTPLVEAGTMTFDVAKVMMIEVCRKFKFGRDVEDALETMVAPEGGGPGAQAAQLKQAMDLAQKTADLRLQQVQADCSTKISKVEEQLVLMVGQLQVAKVQLAEQSLQGAQQAITDAQKGLGDQQALADAANHAAGVGVAADAKVAAANDALHKEQVAHAGTKVVEQVKAAAVDQQHQQQVHKLEVKNLQKPEAGPKVP